MPSAPELVEILKQLEERLGIEREELHIAASRLITPLGLRGMEPLLAPDGAVGDAGESDRLWMLLKFRELDREGVTARLWQRLLDDFPHVLIDAGLAQSDETGPLGFQIPPTLREREQLVLKVLLDGKAFDSDHRMRASRPSAAVS